MLFIHVHPFFYDFQISDWEVKQAGHLSIYLPINLSTYLDQIIYSSLFSYLFKSYTHLLYILLLLYILH